MKLKPKTVKILRQAQKDILREPLQFDMDDWYSSDPAFVDKVPNCGTAACIAGLIACRVKRINPLKASRLESLDPVWSASEISRHALKMEDDQAEVLFLVGQWPESFREAYDACEFSPKLRAHVAVERIEHFIKTGE